MDPLTTKDAAAAADDEEGFHLASFRKNVTGVDHTLWLSAKGGARHAAHIKVAIDPPHTLNHTNETASIAIHDGSVVNGEVPPWLLSQIQKFIRLNRDMLIDYWEDRIDTFDLVRALKPIKD
jgi:hypothetical protein